MRSNHSYLSSYFIVVKVHRRPWTVFFFKVFKGAAGLVLSKLDVIPTAVLLFRFNTFASTDAHAMLASKRHFISDSSRTDGVDKCRLSSACKKMKVSGRLVKLFRDIFGHKKAVCAVARVVKLSSWLLLVCT